MNRDRQPNADPSVVQPSSFAARWWVYQRERFPLLGHGLLIAAFSFSAVCFSRLLRDDPGWPEVKPMIVAYLTALLFFLQLRIADEFKDFEEDLRFRPYRPVQRGLVSLKELGVLGAGAAVVQLALGLWLKPSLVLLLAGVWLYLVLMSKEFFVRGWLEPRPIVYALSHVVIVPLIDLYATACDWWPTLGRPPQGLFWFVIVSYFNGLVIEIGRKIRSPADEEEGVNTYSALWGPRVATFVWLGVMAATAACAVAAAHAIDFLLPVLVWLALLLSIASVMAWRFLHALTPGRGKRIEMLSGLWTLGMYLSIGAAPMLWRQLASSD